MTAPPPPALRALGEADIAFGMALVEAAGWNQTASDWRSFISFRPEGCFLALEGGRPAGTVTTIDHEGRLGWIGMVLVDRELRVGRFSVGREGERILRA